MCIEFSMPLSIVKHALQAVNSKVYFQRLSNTWKYAKALRLSDMTQYYCAKVQKVHVMAAVKEVYATCTGRQPLICGELKDVLKYICALWNVSTVNCMTIVSELVSTY